MNRIITICIFLIAIFAVSKYIAADFKPKPSGDSDIEIVDSGGGQATPMAQDGPEFTEEEIEEELSRRAVQINLQLPAMIADGVRLDRVEAGPGTQFTYHNTLVRVLGENVDVAAVEGMVAEELIPHMCQDKAVRFLLQNDIEVIYSYQSYDNELITHFILYPVDCQL